MKNFVSHPLSPKSLAKILNRAGWAFVGTRIGHSWVYTRCWEDLDLPGVQPVGGFGLEPGLFDKVSIEPVQGPHALRGLGACPFG